MSVSKSEPPSSLLTTGIPWLDRAVGQSGLPPVLDTGGANMLYGQLTASCLSDEYFQRLPIPYRRVGKVRVYEYADVVAYVKELRARALVKTPAPRKRKPPIAPNP
jgi:hypothetical protein